MAQIDHEHASRISSTLNSKRFEFEQRYFVCILLFLLTAPLRATCVLSESSTVKGTILFRQFRHFVYVTGRIRGLDKGLHGFHIHEFGDFSDGCASFGGHYNPAGVNHGE